MAIKSISEIKSKFETGDIPNQNDFEDLIDTLVAFPTVSSLPDLATVATSGDYNDLDNLPVIPSLPTLATVATSGDYNDLDNLPVIPSLPPMLSVAFFASNFAPLNLSSGDMYTNLANTGLMFSTFNKYENGGLTYNNGEFGFGSVVRGPSKLLEITFHTVASVGSNTTITFITDVGVKLLTHVLNPGSYFSTVTSKTELINITDAQYIIINIDNDISFVQFNLTMKILN